MNDIELDNEPLELLEPYFRDISDYAEMCKIEKAQFAALAENIRRVADNFFFATMDEGAIFEWEKTLGIVDTSGDLAFRRVRLLNRISNRPPFTLAFLRQKLDELIGEGEYTIEIDYAAYTLRVEASALDQNYATEVAATIGRIKPAHIVYTNFPYMVSEILISEEIRKDKRNFRYKLGTWSIGKYPFATMQEGEVLKMGGEPSIQSILLKGVANFVSGDVAKARLNESIVIANLAKTVAGGTLTITYDVPLSAGTVTKAELLDANDNILTSSTVYVPVDVGTIFTHTIPVKEGASDD